jgi:energy-coupling factor transporter ATP-binding protein EcfA2
MRIRRVHATAFGALRDKTFEPGPALTVVVGPNESGKSTWHAALYAALCGVPARERWTAAEERFAAYRRPRRSDGWAVEAEIEIGARRVRLTQNLGEPEASTAIDLNTGEDLSDKLRAAGGGLDAARWLGLDRRSFAATAWVEQAGARSALVSTDGRTGLQLAVAACVGEDEVDRALAQIESAWRGYVGSAGHGSAAAATAAIDNERAALAAVDQLRWRRQEAVKHRAAAAGNAEIARKRVLAAKAFEARAEAVARRLEADRVLQASSGGAAHDTEAHPTVVLAELEVRELEREMAELARATEALAAGSTEAEAPTRGRIRVPGLGRVWAQHDHGPASDRPSALDIKLRRDVALTKLASALIARGRRARPTTALEDYENYIVDCGAAARDNEARYHELDGAASAAEQAAEEQERAADAYDLSLPYRESVVDAEQARAVANRELDVANAAVAAVDSELAGYASRSEIEARIARAQSGIERASQLDRVLQRARQELLLARETVLRDIATGMAPRLMDYLAELTDRHVSMADRHELTDQIGASLLRREPELGSFSTSESTFLFTRVALGAHLAGDAPLGPLLVDDVTSSADNDRIRRMLRILRRIAAQRQVMVFAHQSQVRKWAERQMTTDAGITLIRLPGIDADPVIDSPQPVAAPIQSDVDEHEDRRSS